MRPPVPIITSGKGKKGKGTAKNRAETTYPHGFGTRKSLGTGAHHISLCTGKISTAVKRLRQFFFFVLIRKIYSRCGRNMTKDI